MIVNSMFVRRALAAGFATCAFAAPVVAQDVKQITEQNVISGSMSIDFPTRYKLDASGQPDKGVKDIYKFTLAAGRTTEFSGVIYRVPQLKQEGIVREKETQGNQLEYSVDLTVISEKDPTQRKTVGKWVGTVPINDAGEYQLEGTDASKNRISVDAIGRVAAFTENFGGKLVGKPKVRREPKAISFVRKVAGKELKFEVTNSDPMRFDNITLAKGPVPSYPRTLVSGNLDYDYETGNWLTNGIRFKYNLDGTDYEDIVTGSIKWVEDANRASNGKGRYEFNLRFNEEKNQSASTEADAFAGMSDEDAFFAVDTSIPTLTGTMEYVDTIDPSTERVTQSKVTYALHANKLTKQQVLNFFKLWMLGIGPINDE